MDTQPIEEMIVAQARAFAHLQAHAGELTGDAVRRANRLVAALNGVHLAAEGLITALGRQAPDITQHIGAPAPGSNVERGQPAGAVRGSPARAPGAAPASAATIDAAAIFARRREQAQARSPQGAEQRPAQQAAPTAPAATTSAPLDSAAIFARRRAQREATTATEGA